MRTLDIQQIEAKIRRIAKSGTRGVALSRHCKYQRMPERNVDFQDILNVLNRGQVTHDPDEQTYMKFKVTGADLEGEPLCAIIILLDKNSLYIKTVHG